MKARSLTAFFTTAVSARSPALACCQAGSCCSVARGACFVRVASAALMSAGLGGRGGFLAFFPFFAGLGLGAGGRGPSAYASASSLTAARRYSMSKGRSLAPKAVSAAMAFFCSSIVFPQSSAVAPAA